MNFEIWFSQLHPTISARSAQAVLKLAAEDATVPFIARYRKEQTGNLDEVAIQSVIDAHEKWETLLKRQAFIVEEIEKQGKLVPELKEKIFSTFHLDTLEDLYLPYKKKRKTKAMIAKEAGLEPLAEWLWQLGHQEMTVIDGMSVEKFASSFCDAEKNIPDVGSALQGAQDILTEKLAEMQSLRQWVRNETFEKAYVLAIKSEKAKPHSKYERYFDFQETVSSLLKPQNSHRYLALRRGWMEEELTVSIGGARIQIGEEDVFIRSLLQHFENEALKDPGSIAAPILLKAAKMALKAYVLPSIDSEIHKSLKEVADDAAIKVFVENVRKLLLASPMGPKAVLGVDPGIRTGCKLAIIDNAGKYLGSSILHLQTENEKHQSQKMLSVLFKKISFQAIAVGNGTAGRETESYLRETLRELGFGQIPVVMVSESGASVYSASDVAREEFPDLDVTVRGAISIARRLQDPLAELVKVDPKSIGVGQYQHDVNSGSLKKSLDQVVDSCVNQVGVNLNTASYHLLSHVSGIGPALAKSIVEYRGEMGLFKSREDLLKIPRFSKKIFEQSAGFLRIPEAENPLDNTGVHPERYPLLENLAQQMGRTLKDLTGKGIQLIKDHPEFKKLVGDFTFQDILQELEKPGRDSRENFIPFQYREDIHEISDLKPGMICSGIVTNVTNFGAFVDIGVHQDGLVHISQLADRFVKDPREVVSPGDKVQVRILEVNFEKRQIALTRRLDEKSEGKKAAGAPVRQANPGHSQSSAAKTKSSPNHNPFAALAYLKGQLRR